MVAPPQGGARPRAKVAGCLILDIGLAQRICCALARDNARGLNPIPDWSPEDLASEALKGVLRAWPNYNPAWAQSTFITQVAACRIKDVQRKHGRRLKVEFSLTAETMDLRRAPSPVNQPHDRTAPEPEDLADWLGQTYRFIRSIFVSGNLPLRTPGMNKRYPDRAQRAALLLLMQKLACSSRGLVLVLDQRPALLAAIRMERTPHHRTIRRLRLSGTRLGITRPSRINALFDLPGE